MKYGRREVYNYMYINISRKVTEGIGSITIQKWQRRTPGWLQLGLDRKIVCYQVIFDQLHQLVQRMWSGLANRYDGM